jgi:hypothetical protein
VWVRDWKSEMLLVELGNDDWLRPHASDPSVGGSWVPAYHWKSELLVALLSCSATTTHPSVLCLCSTARVGWSATQVLCGHLI